MLRKAVVMVSAIVGVLGFCCLGYSADLDKGLGFYLPFDNSLDAKVSSGVEVPKKAPIVKYEKGVKGDGVVINGMDKLVYPVKKGYLSFEEGTISFWVKANYDNPAFREKVNKNKRTQGWYFTQYFIDVGSWDKLRCEFYLCQIDSFRFALAVQTGHYKDANFSSLEKDKWVNFLCTWNTDDENLEFYINGKRTEGRLISKKGFEDFWELPEEIDYSLCTIMIGGAAFHGTKTAAERKRLSSEFLPKNFTYTIDEFRMYNRVLTEEEIEELSSKESPII